MTVLENILETLNKVGYWYERIEHEPVYTSEEAAKIRDTSLDIGAKALVCMADKKPVLVVLPGSSKINFSKFKKEFGIKDLRLATPEQVEEITTLEIGAIPPTGNILGLPTYFDSAFKTKGIIAFNAGAHTTSVRMKAVDLIDMVNPVFGDYAEKA